MRMLSPPFAAAVSGGRGPKWLRAMTWWFGRPGAGRSLTHTTRVGPTLALPLR